MHYTPNLEVAKLFKIMKHCFISYGVKYFGMFIKGLFRALRHNLQQNWFSCQCLVHQKNYLHFFVNSDCRKYSVTETGQNEFGIGAVINTKAYYLIVCTQYYLYKSSKNSAINS
jgi:hypothetical protein